MKIDFKKIINIKKKEDLREFKIEKPIFQSNYLFHYLIQLGNLDGLKLVRFPIYIENVDNLNGFHLASKEYNFNILCYLIENYSEYIYNRNDNKELFTHYLPIEEFTKFIKKYPKLNWSELITNDLLKVIFTNLHFSDLNNFTTIYNIKPEFKN